MNITTHTTGISEESHRLLRVLLHLGRRLRGRRQDTELPPMALQVLGVIYRRGPVTATAIAEELRVKKQSLTALLRFLQAGGFLLRDTDAKDARKVALSLSGEGRGMLLRDLGERGRYLERIIETSLDAGERRALLDALPVLEKLAGHAEPDSAQSPSSSVTRG